jgi:hypothetical protein
MAGLDVEELSGLPDEKFIAALTAISGIGPRLRMSQMSWNFGRSTVIVRRSSV